MRSHREICKLLGSLNRSTVRLFTIDSLCQALLFSECSLPKTLTEDPYWRFLLKNVYWRGALSSLQSITKSLLGAKLNATGIVQRPSLSIPLLPHRRSSIPLKMLLEGILLFQKQRDNCADPTENSPRNSSNQTNFCSKLLFFQFLFSSDRWFHQWTESQRTSTNFNGLCKGPKTINFSRIFEQRRMDFKSVTEWAAPLCFFKTFVFEIQTSSKTGSEHFK